MDKNIKLDEVGKQIAKSTNKYVGQDFIPGQIEEKVQLTMDVNPYGEVKTQNVMINLSNPEGAPNPSPFVIYTTPTGNVDFYLKVIHMSCSDADGSDGVNTVMGTLSGNSTGNPNTLMTLCWNSATGIGSGSNNDSIEFPKAGILMAPGTTILFYAQASDQNHVQIVGYTIDRNIYTQNAGRNS
jgi:hypothetical protein